MPVALTDLPSPLFQTLVADALAESEVPFLSAAQGPNARLVCYPRMDAFHGTGRAYFPNETKHVMALRLAAWNWFGSLCMTRRHRRALCGASRGLRDCMATRTTETRRDALLDAMYREEGATQDLRGVVFEREQLLMVGYVRLCPFKPRVGRMDHLPTLLWAAFRECGGLYNVAVPIRASDPVAARFGRKLRDHDMEPAWEECASELRAAGKRSRKRPLLAAALVEWIFKPLKLPYALTGTNITMFNWNVVPVADRICPAVVPRWDDAEVTQLVLLTAWQTKSVLTPCIDSAYSMQAVQTCTRFVRCPTAQNARLVAKVARAASSEGDVDRGVLMLEWTEAVRKLAERHIAVLYPVKFITDG